MTDTVVVTGALGGAGSWLMDDLRDDYDVVAVDRTLPGTTDIDGVTFLAVDLTEQGPIWETVLDGESRRIARMGTGAFLAGCRRGITHRAGLHLIPLSIHG